MGIRGHSSVVSLEEMIRPSPISSRSTMAGTLTRQQKKNVRLVMFLILLACYHNSIRVRSFLLRAALVPPSLSPWRKLYDEGDSSSFLHVTGLTREAFDSLVMIVIPPGHSLRRRRRGRPWSLPPDGMLGLLLCYLGSQMTMKWLCLIFGITPSPCCRIFCCNPRCLRVRRAAGAVALPLPSPHRRRQCAAALTPTPLGGAST